MRKEMFHKTKLDELRAALSDAQLRSNELACESGNYAWLTVIPVSESNYVLNKEQFWANIRLRYGWATPCLPAMCACGCNFTIQHSMSCKKGGFVSLRHNEVRDITAQLLKEVCNDVGVEPTLLKMSGESLSAKSTKCNNEVRLDVSARGFWIRGQMAFFDVRVLRYSNQTLKQECYANNEREKKRQYNERIMQVDQGSFTPLVFTVTGGMGHEYKVFFFRLAQMISRKRNLQQSVVTSWIRKKINFALIRSMSMCLRGSRSIEKCVSNDIEIESSIQPLSK